MIIRGLRFFGRISPAILLVLLIANYVVESHRSNKTNVQFLPLVVKPLPQGAWTTLDAIGQPTARHEASFIQFGGKFYLLGGRGEKPVDVYNPASNRWIAYEQPPTEIHHFQAVVYNDLIYAVGAWRGSFPYEANIDNVLIYNPIQDSWQTGHTIPEERRRGSAGVVVYNDKIYVVGGAVGGHGTHATTVNWFDEYDPVTGEWVQLPDAPHVRDHFQAAIVGDKLVAVGGRNTSTTDFFNNTIAAVDVYDFTTGAWYSVDDLPTQRAGTMTGVLNGQVVVTGGEGFGVAWPQTEMLDLASGTWRSLAPLVQARHGTQIAECNGGLYVASGAGGQGGGPELTTLEAFFLEEARPCP